MIGIKAQQAMVKRPSPPTPNMPYSELITHWFRSDRGLTLDESSRVVEWENIAENGTQNTGQPTDSLRPSLANGINGLPVVRSTGGKWLTDLDITAPSGFASLPDNRTWVFVFDVSAYNRSANPITGSSVLAGSKLSSYYRESPGDYRLLSGNFVNNCPKIAIFCCSFSVTSANYSINGSSLTASQGDNLNFDAVDSMQFLRNTAAYGEEYFQGDLMEMITWDKPEMMTLSELQGICDQLNEYYNFY